MKSIRCELCGSNEFVKDGDEYQCLYCHTRYSTEDAKKMMIEGTVDVQGTVKLDNSSFVQKYLENARRAYNKEDWEEVEKYYNMVEQNSPNNIEAIFFSSYGRVMLALYDDQYFKREQKIKVLRNSISVIDENYEISDENKDDVIKKISTALLKMYKSQFVRQINQAYGVGSATWQMALFREVNNDFIRELEEILTKHEGLDYIKELIDTHRNAIKAGGGCYVATCVYGSYDCPEVWTLRRYRDFKLYKTLHGRIFIKVYYAISPTVVRLFGKTKWFNKIFKKKLDKMVCKLKYDGYESTPYNDLF